MSFYNYVPNNFELEFKLYIRIKIKIYSYGCQLVPENKKNSSKSETSKSRVWLFHKKDSENYCYSSQSPSF